MTRTVRSLILLMCAFLVLTTALIAQKTTGDIQGTVTDPQGAVVNGAKVSVRNVATNAERSAMTDASGVYTVANLDAGKYEVKVSNQGFKETVFKEVELHVASVTTLNVKMQMGAASEIVNVESNAVQVETSTAAVGEVVDGTQVRELPLNGRSFVQLTQLQPGVSAANNFDSKNKGLMSGVDFAVNGNPTTNNLFLVDGANNNDIGSNRTILIYPSIDAISEFKMITNAYGPEYGQASGSVITIVTRGGQNQFHGGLSYFGRNDVLNARDYFNARQAAADKLAGFPITAKDKLRRNDTAYNIGGPIVKNKLFFFWSQEWNQEVRGNTRHSCVPTAAEKSGDFSGPLSCGAAVPNTATAFPGTWTGLKINNPSPAGLLIAQLLPLPNTTPSAATGGANWVKSLPSGIKWREENARIDYNINKKHSITFRYTQDSWKNPAPNTLNFWGDDPFPAVEGNWDQPSKSIVAKVTSTLTNTLINDAQFSYSNNRIHVTGGGDNPTLVDKINAAFPTAYPAAGKFPGGMMTIWGGLGNYGSGQNLWLISPFENAQDLYTVRDDVSKAWGNHTFKAGLYLSWNGKNEAGYGGQDRPSFSTGDCGWCGGAPTSLGGPGASPTGNNLANILIRGQLFGMSENSLNIVDHARWRDYEFYFGDTWKARSNLTIEYGIRWSFLPNSFSADNAITSWNAKFYDPAKPASDVCNGLVVVPGTDPCGDVNKATGSTYSKGTPGPNSALRNNNNHAIAPRLGISWDPWHNGKTAIRFGIGQFFQRERISPQVGSANNAPFALSTFLVRTLDTQPGAPSSGTSPSTGVDPRDVLPNSWQWNISVERELAKETTLQLGYVANRGLHLTTTYDQNFVLPQNRVAAAFQGQAGGLNPLRRAPAFGTVNIFSRDGWSTYHALQASFHTRIRSWVRLQMAYTWSHSISDTELDNSSGGGNQSNFSALENTGLDKGNSTINRPQIFVANAIFNLPSLKGHNSLVRGVFGDWEFTTISTIENGNSLTVYLANVQDGNGCGGLGQPACPAGYSALASLSGTGFNQNQRPNLSGTGSCNSGLTSGHPEEQFFNPAAFTLNGFKIGSIGNASRGSCRGPSNVNSDLAFYKNWSVKEKLKIQFRLEFFNAFNHVNFRGDSLNQDFNGGSSLVVKCGATVCTPTNNTITSYTLNPGSSFGIATRTRGPREIQYAIKFNF